MMNKMATLGDFKARNTMPLVTPASLSASSHGPCTQYLGASVVQVQYFVQHLPDRLMNGSKCAPADRPTPDTSRSTADSLNMCNHAGALSSTNSSASSTTTA